MSRAIGLLRATALVVGIIIGASIFVQPAEIARQVPDVRGVLLVWLLAGVLTLFGALVCAELASAFPRAGGVYVFLKESWSPAAGFLWGWAMFWCMHSAIVAAIAVVVARYFAFFVPLSDGEIRALAIALIAALSIVNITGVRAGTAVQTGFTIAKVAGIVIMLTIVALLAPPHATVAGPAVMPGLRGVIGALVAALFTYGGWHMVTYAAEETREAERTIPRALMIGIVIVTLCYVGLNVAYFRVLPLDRLVRSDRVAADVAMALTGARGAAAVSIVVMVSAIGALAGVILAGPRVYFAMARDGLLFRWLGALHPRFETPHRAIALQAAWSAVLVATGTYRGLFTRVITTEWIFFALMAAGLFPLRRRPGYAPAYRTWGYPLVPLFFIASTMAIIVTQIAAEPVESATGLLLVIAGLPVYYWWSRGHRLS